MSKVFFMGIISALGVLILLNLFGLIGFIILVIGGTLIFMLKNERSEISTKERVVAKSVLKDAKNQPRLNQLKIQRDTLHVKQT